MPRFIALARDAYDWESLAPEKLEAFFGRYVAFDQKLGESGKVIAGEKLADDGRVIRRDGSQNTVTETVYEDSKEGLGGYTIVEAADYNEAVTLLSEHPHLEVGSIEIRRLEEMGAE